MTALNATEKKDKINLLPIYHGSDKIIKKPEYGKGAVNNDYGLGFYCTKNFGLGGEWAVSKTKESGYINQYMYNPVGLRELELDKCPVETWIAVLMNNRRGRNSPAAFRRRTQFLEKFLIDISEYDIITGWRADDSFFTFVEDFMVGDITREELIKSLKIGDLGIQICLKSEKSFREQHIEWVKFHQAPVDKYYPLYLARDRKARNDYQKLLRESDGKGIRVTDMLKGDYHVGI